MNELPETAPPPPEAQARLGLLSRVKFLRRIFKRRQELRVGWMILDALTVIVLIALGFAAKPAYRAFREDQIRRNFEAAKSAALREDWGTARDKARSVLLARGQDFETYRIWARAVCKLNSPSAYMAAAEVYSDPRATRGDMLEQLEVMVRQAPQAVALNAHACLPPIYRDEADFRAVIVPLLIQRGQSELAEKSLRAVMSSEDGPKVKLELLRVLCSRSSVEHVVEAQRVFADLIATHADEQALTALLILGEVPLGLVEGDPLPDLPEWLKHQPKATALHHLLGLHPALRARPESAPGIYEMAVKRFLASDPAVLGSWLLRHEQAEMAVTLLEEAATTRSDAFIARLNALMRLKRDAEVVTAMAAPPASVDLVELEIMQANLAARRGDSIASGGAWTRALNLAVYDTTRNRCIDIARIAQRCGARDAVDDAWVAAVRLGWGPLPPYADLLPVYASLLAKNRSEDLMALFRSLLRFEPRNPQLLNNAYYFALLEGVQSPNQVVSVISKLIERQDKPVYNATLMLAEMLDEHPADALALLPKVCAGTEVPPRMIAALEGTARVLVGETAAGSAMLAEVNWHEFMPQERKLFRSILVKYKSSKLSIPDLANPAAAVNPAEIPAWRKVVERFEKERAGDVLPTLLVPKIPGTNQPGADDSSQSRAWRKALSDTEKKAAGETLPPLPERHAPPAVPAAAPPPAEP